VKTLTGTFESRAQAEDAFLALQDAGVPSADVILQEDDRSTSVTARVEDGKLDAAAAILNQSGSVDVDEPSLEGEELGRAADPLETDAPVIVQPLHR
jgi:hypothetical protein